VDIKVVVIKADIKMVINHGLTQVIDNISKTEIKTLLNFSAQEASTAITIITISITILGTTLG
jgi:hypothetical protein